MYCDVSCIYIVMYFVYCRVQVFMVLWAHCEWWDSWATHLWAHPHLSQMSPTHYTFLHSPVGWAPHAQWLASHLLCGVCIRTTLYTYSPCVYHTDGSHRCTGIMSYISLVSCRRVWYIFNIYVIHFHSLYGILLVAHILTHLHLSGT